MAVEKGCTYPRASSLSRSLQTALSRNVRHSPPLLTQAGSLQTRRLSRFLLRVAVQIPAAPGPSRLCATSSALSPEA